MYCPACNRNDLTKDDFYKNIYRKNGCSTYCKICTKKKRNESYELNKDKIKIRCKTYRNKIKEQNQKEETKQNIIQ